jgi:cytochrome b
VSSTTTRLTIWDLPTRIFHWAIVVLLPLNFWVLEPGESAHEWAGYTIAALLAFRLLWGVCGSANARFSSFWPTPRRLMHHWAQLKSRHFDPAGGHNPLGAIMILLMLSLLGVVAVSGWMQGLDRFWGEDWVQVLHEYAANTLMIAAAIHIPSVLLMSRYTRLRLVRTMLLGWRPAQH